jgi:hypothetical protein
MNVTEITMQRIRDEWEAPLKAHIRELEAEKAEAIEIMKNVFDRCASMRQFHGDISAFLDRMGCKSQMVEGTPLETHVITDASCPHCRIAALEAALAQIRDFRQEENEWDGVDECMPSMRNIARTALIGSALETDSKPTSRSDEVDDK